MRCAVAIALAALLLLAPAASFAANGRAPTEYELKAIFLYNFTKYVEWPAEALAEGPLRLCVIGDDPFGRLLDDALAGETVQGRPLAARRVSGVGEAEGCHLLFVSSSERGRLDGILGALRERAVLTVSEIEDFAVRGGMIRLRDEGNRVRLAINVDAVQRAGLKISSQLLKLGEIVRSAGAAR